MIPFPPLSHLNGYFTYTFIPSVTKVSAPSPKSVRRHTRVIPWSISSCYYLVHEQWLQLCGENLLTGIRSHILLLWIDDLWPGCDTSHGIEIKMALKWNSKIIILFNFKRFSQSCKVQILLSDLTTKDSLSKYTELLYFIFIVYELDKLYNDTIVYVVYGSYGSANEEAAFRCQLVFNYGLVFHYGLSWLALHPLMFDWNIMN